MCANASLACILGADVKSVGDICHLCKTHLSQSNVQFPKMGNTDTGCVGYGCGIIRMKAGIAPEFCMYAQLIADCGDPWLRSA